MAQIHPAWLEHQRRIWLRHDWQKWLRPEWQKWMPPDPGPSMRERLWRPYRDESSTETGPSASELAELQRSLSGLRLQLAVIKADLRRKAGFNPDQPRVPAGNNILSGRWTREGGSASSNSNRAIRLAGDITGFTKHGINQTITRGVPPSAIRDAVVNPIQILPQANGTTRYIGAGAVVVLNPAGQVVTTWGR